MFCHIVFHFIYHGDNFTDNETDEETVGKFSGQQGQMGSFHLVTCL